MTAERQTEGRGRRGRNWVSPPGGLYATLLLIDPAPFEHLGNLPLVVATGLANGIASLRGIETDAVRIKWPNDVLIGDAKCVGILIESERSFSGAPVVVIGCGINLDPPEASAGYPMTGLRREGYEGTIDEAFEKIADGVENALSRWDRGRGFDAIRGEWISRAKGIGAPCTVNLADRSVSGLFLELDPSGRLVLEKPDGAREIFSAGDLFFQAVAA